MNKFDVSSRLRNVGPLNDRQAIEYVSENIALFLWMRAVHILLGRPFLRRIDGVHNYWMDLIPRGLGGSVPAAANGLRLVEYVAPDADQDDE